MRCNNCILNLLKVIDLLQRNSSNDCSFEFGCDKPYLGPTASSVCYNTRPISLYKKDGSIFSVNNYTVFRVEKVENDCVVLQALSGTSPNFLQLENLLQFLLSVFVLFAVFLILLSPVYRKEEMI